MGVPKSVIKFKKGNVEYTSSVDRASYTIMELSRAAVRDAAKYITRMANASAMRLPGLKKSHRVRGKTSAFRYVVPWAKEGLPHAEIGITHDTWYGVEQELGTSNQPKRQILRSTAYDNIAKIVEIEAQYLSAMEDEAKALTLIDEQQHSTGGDANG